MGKNLIRDKKKWDKKGKNKKRARFLSLQIYPFVSASLLPKVSHDLIRTSNIKWITYRRRISHVALLLTWFVPSVNASVALVAHTIEKDSSSGSDIKVQRRCEGISHQCRQSRQQLQARQPWHVAPHPHLHSFQKGRGEHLKSTLCHFSNNSLLFTQWSGILSPQQGANNPN